MTTDTDTNRDESGAANDELDFHPHLTVDVPRETFVEAMEWAGIEGDPEDLAPYSPGSEPNDFEQALFEHYLPTFTWRVADDETED